ncbi:hypothetical protein [Cupriavidus pinatubonensis]|uniref:hypothetical protein n=1 Tax=Cupriavidus pinatubonensis TaxID=248026 RepID=UPI0036146E73
MRASMHLGRLHSAAQYRIIRLTRSFQSLTRLPNPEQGQKLAYIAIELDNLNICTLREFTISTIRGAKTVSGQKISVSQNLGPEDEIAAYMLSVTNSVKYRNLRSPARITRKDEQAIRDPKEIEKILIHCNASNLQSLQSALALNSSMFRDLKFLRHFYAHRNVDTLSKAYQNAAASLGFFNPSHPDDILLHVVPGKTTPVIEEWLAEAQIFYDLLMQ